MKNVALGASLLAGLLCSCPAFAQRNDNPNMKMFYMARQQIQITDDGPAVNDMRTVAQPGQQSAAAPAPSPGQGLPRAGFASNMSAYHGGGGGTGLPTVNNGVPAKLPQAPTGGKAQNGLKAGNAGKLKAKAAPVASQSPAVRAYKPYATTPVVQAPAGQNGSLLNSSQNVRGSVLHWNKHH